MTKLIDTPKCLLVGNLPEGVKTWWINFRQEIELLNENKICVAIIPLPPGSYGQPILASEMMNDCEKCCAVVEEIEYSPHFKDYTGGWTRDELISFSSLLESHNLQPSTTVVIPKTLTHA